MDIVDRELALQIDFFSVICTLRLTHRSQAFEKQLMQPRNELILTNSLSWMYLSTRVEDAAPQWIDFKQFIALQFDFFSIICNLRLTHRLKAFTPQWIDFNRFIVLNGPEHPNGSSRVMIVGNKLLTTSVSHFRFSRRWCQQNDNIINYCNNMGDRIHSMRKKKKKKKKKFVTKKRLIIHHRSLMPTARQRMLSWNLRRWFLIPPGPFDGGGHVDFFSYMNSWDLCYVSDKHICCCYCYI